MRRRFWILDFPRYGPVWGFSIGDRSRITHHASRIGVGICKRTRGLAYVELLIATIVLSMAAAGAVATWAISSRAAANKRLTEMGVYLGVREVERLKAQKFLGLLNGAQGPFYYDRLGAPAPGNTAITQGYRVESLVSTVLFHNAKIADDLRELHVTVKNNAGTITFDTEQTLISLGGI